jgi:hypothetical protein
MMMMNFSGKNRFTSEVEAIPGYFLNDGLIKRLNALKVELKIRIGGYL